MYESIILTLTANKFSLSTNYFPPINKCEASEIALLCLQSYNTSPNINETNNHLKIKIKTDDLSDLCGNKTVDIIIESGCYGYKISILSIYPYYGSDIKSYILKIVNDKNAIEKKEQDIIFDMWVNTTDFRLYIKCNQVMNFEVDNSLAFVLGFKKIGYNNAEYRIYRSENSVNIN